MWHSSGQPCFKLKLGNLPTFLWTPPLLGDFPECYRFSFVLKAPLYSTFKISRHIEQIFPKSIWTIQTISWHILVLYSLELSQQCNINQSIIQIERFYFLNINYRLPFLYRNEHLKMHYYLFYKFLSRKMWPKCFNLTRIFKGICMVK